MNPEEFIATIAPVALRDWRGSGVSAALTIAQAILESNWGTSALAVQANNLFGMKGTGSAGSITLPTTEYRAGVPYTIQAAFRKYKSWEESVADHTRLLLNQRYQQILRRPGKEAARYVAAAGYATDPNYAKKLIALMDKYDLYHYDAEGGEEPMTAEEKKQFEALQQTVQQQAIRIAELEKRANLKTPDWAKEAVKAAVNYDKKHPLIQSPEQGSYDFYRLITIMYRRGLFNKPDAG
ncbi:glycoside hydrolase family 73 protein [Paenibacillus humicus]|uniref:glycoside hydrolase family 73 protein n=1 Tax=Paenibacillus humicus TaxID=412861 RepID=UPI003D2A9B86